jgi:hypothetical protein
MSVIRIFLQVVFGLLSLIVVFFSLRGPNPDYAANLPMLAIFIAIILVLGPWWPSADKAQKWKLDLLTDDPRVAGYLLCAALGSYASYNAWDRYMDPTDEFMRFERSVAALAGPGGVVAAWIMIAIGCFASAVRFYRKRRSART